MQCPSPAIRWCLSFSTSRARRTSEPIPSKGSLLRCTSSLLAVCLQPMQQRAEPIRRRHCCEISPCLGRPTSFAGRAHLARAVAEFAPEGAAELGGVVEAALFRDVEDTAMIVGIGKRRI